MLWDLIQDWRLSDQRADAENIEARVDRLERQLKDTRAVVRELMIRLEQKLGEDINGDGRIG
ncbi:MAG: hypothetical protein IT355_06775 [Gemmatimonadaceae bacterium]|nr:hypothetical protein [Gemmatimonadaceae bacterium]